MTKSVRLKAKTFDLMQYLYGAVHNPLIHAKITLNGHINETVLKKAALLTAETLPELSCCLNADFSRPIWEKHAFTGDNMVFVVDAESDIEKQTETLLAAVIDICHEPQIKIFVQRADEYDILCVIVNHMICDGAGFKEYLYLLCSIYTQLLNGHSVVIPSPASRGTKILFSKYGFFQKLRIASLKYDLSKQKHQTLFAVEGDRNNPFFVTEKIESNELTAIKNYAKNRSATLNDMMLTAFARCLSKKTGQKNIVIPCPVDLRKYIPPKKKYGICNLTSNYIIDVTVNKGDAFDDTLKQASEQMEQQKQSDACLKSVIMLETVFHLLPFWLIKKEFLKFFTIPVLSYTNFGIVDKTKLHFGCVEISNLYLTGAVKFAPYFQIAVSTFDNIVTLSSNLYGTRQDRLNTDQFLKEIKECLQKE